MIFWIFVVLTILALVFIVATITVSDKCGYPKNGNSKKFVEFVHYNDDVICCISGITAAISGFVVVVMLIFIVSAQMTAGGYRASNEQRYDALIYKAQTERIRDEFGIVNKEYIDEVQSWNEDVAKYQTYSDSFWIGIFYPKRAFDGFETIDLKEIRMKE